MCLNFWETASGCGDMASSAYGLSVAPATGTLNNVSVVLRAVLVILLFCDCQAATPLSSTLVYSQPKNAVDISTNVFPNPRSPWPRPGLINHTCSVFWQRNHLNGSLVTPAYSSGRISRATGIAVEPQQQAVCCSEGARVAESFIPWSAVQYSSNGMYGAALNTTGAKETLSTTTIETSFGACLDVWNKKEGSSFEVEYALAVPTAFKQFSKDDQCAVYISLSVYVKSKEGSPQHFIWYETKAFDYERDVVNDHVFIDTISNKLIISSPLSNVSKYNAMLPKSSKSSNKAWQDRKYFGYKVASEHLEQGIRDGLDKFPSHFPQGLPLRAQDYCISGFNLELEATPNAGAGLNLRDLSIRINR